MNSQCWALSCSKHLKRTTIILSLLCCIMMVILSLMVSLHQKSNKSRIIQKDFPGCHCGRGNVPDWIATLNNVLSSDERMTMTCTDPRSIALGRTGQKVVSFSLYQEFHEANLGTMNKLSYLNGCIENMELAQRIYPGWQMRIYHNFTRAGSSSTACSMLCEGRKLYPHVSLCYVVDLPYFPSLTGTFGVFWRFLPMIDSQVDTFLSRDADSRLNDREAAAVSQWLESGKTLHLMRDHPAHGAAILAGMWGTNLARTSSETPVENEARRSLVRDLATRMFEEAVLEKQEKGLDQDILASVLSPYFTASGDYVDHSSFLCNQYGFRSRPFPTRRNLSADRVFVGAPDASWRNNGSPATFQACPIECRPDIEWEYC